jgi:GNAT superfamily N-acetyltransferase
MDDLPYLPAIESAATKLFFQFEETAELPLYLTPLEDFTEAQRAGRLWVAISSSGLPIGFALVDMLSESAHLQEIDVHPDFGRRGIGASLVRMVCDWAETRGIPIVTLTTFREIPWNEPFYRKLGFEELRPEEMSEEIARIIDDEEQHGLPRELRIAMRYKIF